MNWSDTRIRHRGAGRTTNDAGDRGSAGIETPIAVVALLMLVFFVAGGSRIMTDQGAVESAARSAARAAASARNASDAQQRASAAATDALSGSSCSGAPSVGVSGWSPGGAVTVSVGCVIDMSGLRLLFSDREVSASAVEYVDLLRGSDE